MLNWLKETIALLFLLAITLWPAGRISDTKAQHIPPQQEGIGVSITIEAGALPPPVPEGPRISGGAAEGVVRVIPVPATVVFKGYSYPEALVTFVKNGAIIGNTLADNDGVFKKEIGADPGIFTFGIWARDQLGFNSTTTNISISLTGGTKTTIANIILSPTIAANKSTVTQGEKLIIYGITTPRSTIRIFNNYSPGQILSPVKAKDNGNWEYILETLELKSGDYSLKANAQLETLGLISAFSSNLLFTIQEKRCYGSDLNNDGKVDTVDFSILMFYWNKPLLGMKDKLINSCVDTNSDGFVGLADFSVMMYRWTG